MTMTEPVSTVTITEAAATTSPGDAYITVRDAQALVLPAVRAPKPGDYARRTFAIEHRNLNIEARTAELAFSSETPVERFFGDEILSHDRGAVRMQRMENGAALLVNHDSDQQVGVVESASLDADRTGRAVVRFGRSARAEEIFQDVIDGIRRHVSVGYLIHDINESERGVVRVTDWEPLEISIVAVPADASVGVGRSVNAGTTETEEDIMSDRISDALEERDDELSPPEGGAGGEARDEGGAEDRAEQRAEDRAKIDARIRELGVKYRLGTAAEDLIAVRGSVEDMEHAVRQSIINRKPEPVPSARALHISGGAPRYRKLRGAWRDLGEDAAYRSGMWARATLFGDQKALAWCRDHSVRVMTGTAVSDGGALVPDEMSQAIIDNREDYGVMRSIANVVPMDSDTLTVPRRAGGVTAYFAGREDATTESDKSWDQVQLVARELSALSRFSRQYAEDAVIDVAMDLADEMAYAFAEKEDDCAINGDGTSTYGGIVGLRTALLLAANAGSVVTAASGVDTYGEMDSADLDNLRAKLPEYAAMNAQWLLSKAGKNLVVDPILAAGGGNTKVDLGGRLVDAYLGDPVRVSQKMPTSTGDLSDVIMALYGDFRRACTLGDRRGFSVQVLTERYAEYRQIGVIATERFDFVAHDLGTATAAGPVVGFKGN